MVLQIIDPSVIEKINRLSALTGLSQTAAIELAIDYFLNSFQPSLILRINTAFHT
jgi:hypothetical protein